MTSIMAWRQLANDLDSLAVYLDGTEELSPAFVRAMQLEEKYPLDIRRVIEPMALHERVDSSTGESVMVWTDSWPPIERIHENCSTALEVLKRLGDMIRFRAPTTAPIISNLPEDSAGRTDVESPGVDADIPTQPPEPIGLQERRLIATKLHVLAEYFVTLDQSVTSGSRDGWLTVSQAHKLTGAGVAQISQAASMGKFVSHGKRSKRKIEPKSFIAWFADREKRADERSERKAIQIDGKTGVRRP
jgi:hypothetical protein